ncbi:MAG: thiamine pyrophosphate-dependent enzyme [Gammaproteobacteria bacterium]
MKRIDALEAIYPRLERCIVVTIMGAVAAELQSFGHRPGFFYLQHAMGLASSMALGIALSRPQLDVVVLEGDGSVLMNLGGLSTLARYKPANLTQIVFDNESLLSVGGFPTATSTGTDLAGVARAAGIPHSSSVASPAELSAALEEAQTNNLMSSIVAKVDAHYEPPSATQGFLTDLGLLENRFEFARHLKATESTAGAR